MCRKEWFLRKNLTINLHFRHVFWRQVFFWCSPLVLFDIDPDWPNTVNLSCGWADVGFEPYAWIVSITVFSLFLNAVISLFFPFWGKWPNKMHFRWHRDATMPSLFCCTSDVCCWCCTIFAPPGHRWCDADDGRQEHVGWTSTWTLHLESTVWGCRLRSTWSQPEKLKDPLFWISLLFSESGWDALCVRIATVRPNSCRKTSFLVKLFVRFNGTEVQKPWRM